MPKYMVQASYTPDGAQGLISEGATSRREALTTAVASVGGSVENLYYAFGDTDLYIIIDAPDRVSAAALGLAIGAAGALTWSTTVLLTPEEIDEAVSKVVNYRPPGA